MKITPLSQNDDRWSHVRIGTSNLTIGGYGCTIASICMALEKLRGYPASPADAAFWWRFNERGEILWMQTAFEGAVFKWRGHFYDSLKVKEYADSKDKAVVLEVNYNHWVYVVESTGRGLRTMRVVDPWNGVLYETLPNNYTPTGFALFEVDKRPLPDWAKEEYDELTELSPHFASLETNHDITATDIQKVLADLERIEKVGDLPAYRLAVMLKKLNAF